MDEFYVPRSQKAVYLNAWAWVIGVIVMVAVIAVGVFVVRWITAPAKGKLAAREQINSGNFRIQAYNHFFDLCASVQTNEQALAQSYADLKTATGDNKTRIQTNIAGQLNSRNDAANQYNADSHKGYTVGQFKSASLPYTIPVYKQGVVTSCGS